jgi:plastocyanin
MRKLLVVALIAVLAAVFAAQALAARRGVKIGDNYFVRKGDPPTVTVHKGDTVKWTWTGDHLHNVRVRRGPVRFHSDFMDSGTYSHKMRRVGTYRIVCTIHQASGMRMTLRVIR